MELKEIVAISGLSGLHKVVANRNDGLIVQTFGEKKPRFVSSRIHMFTPLDSITVYTLTDNVELSKVLQSMKEKATEVPPVSPKASNDELKTYFAQVLPDYDPERVYTSDIKKIVKWYLALDKHGVLEVPEAKEEKKPKKKAEATKEESEKPAKKKAKKKAAGDDKSE